MPCHLGHGDNRRTCNAEGYREVVALLIGLSEAETFQAAFPRGAWSGAP